MKQSNLAGSHPASKREVVQLALDHKHPPYVPWSFSFTWEARQALERHFGASGDDLDELLGNHLLELGSAGGFYKDIGNDRVQDVFGVVWDRSQDKDIGNVEGHVLPEPTMEGFELPDPRDPRFFADIPKKIARFPDRFRLFAIGFSLFERAWTLRGMENLLMDFIENPEFVHELFARIADYNIAQVKAALDYDIDGVYFGDDWGQQHGLIMGYEKWREFIYPQIRRMYAVARNAGKRQFIHSCGDVDELFEDLVSVGLNCFNPFQPEVMDTAALMKTYAGRLSFWGGLSTQSTLPYKGVADVREESERLLRDGARGGYIFSPAHAVEGDVPLDNMLAFIEAAHSQPAVRQHSVQS